MLDTTVPAPSRDHGVDRRFQKKPMKIAVIGAGISGLSCGWLLAREHDVSLYEANAYFGGHTHTHELTIPGPDGALAPIAVDSGFIVFNDRNYPNLVALFDSLNVPYHNSVMSFSVSMHNARLEYAGNHLSNIFAQPINALRPSFWKMLWELRRFYLNVAPLTLDDEACHLTLGAYLEQNRYDPVFVEHHLLPMVAAIWSCPIKTARDYPFASFLKFCQNHGLVQFSDRPQWKTVTGGSKTYVDRILETIPNAFTNTRIQSVTRSEDQVTLIFSDGHQANFDHVVFACHADTALSLLSAPTSDERRLLGACRYASNRAYLHSDPSMMPRRRRAWAAWNYLSKEDDDDVFVSYWINRLQGIQSRDPVIVSLNPPHAPASETTYAEMEYDHPVFDLHTERAQSELWTLQGRQRSWYCGAYFGAGFHEDGLQAGLAVAEHLGGVMRPWNVPGANDRIHLPYESSWPPAMLV